MKGYQHLILEASSLDSFVENSSQYLQTKLEIQSLCFNIVTSKPRLFQRFFTCMYGRTQSELYSQHQHVIHKEASGRHLLYPAPILLVLFSTFLDQRQKQERPSFHALYLCVTYRCCFFHSKRLRKKTKQRSPFWCLWVLAVVWVKLGWLLAVH